MKNSNKILRERIIKLLKEQSQQTNISTSISQCFNENSCDSSLRNKLPEILNDLSLPNSRKTQEKLLSACKSGPKNAIEETFCRVALTLCGVDINTCLSEKMK